MKTIKKIKDNIGKVAGSALLVGATLAGGAAMVSAQDSGSSGDLGDYPAPFVDDDGEVDASVVVGEEATNGDPVSTLDVVAGIEVAGSLGNAAFTEEEVSVSTEGTSASWSAENGATLNRQNSNIFFPEGTATEQTRFDAEDISSLGETTFQSEDNEEVTVEHDLNVGDQGQNFDADAGDLDDPSLYVDVPTTIDPSDSEEYLFSTEVEFSETMDFTEQDSGDDAVDDNADEVLEDGDTIELFGNEYTYSDETSEDELVLYGSSDRFEVATGESDTVTVDGEDHEFQVEYVSESSDTQEATVIVDGSTQSVEESDTINVGDAEVRVSDIYRTGPDGQGRVAFSQGSDEVNIDENGDVNVDGETLDSVNVNIDSDPASSGETFSAVDGMTFAFGAADSDENLVQAGETYEDPLFGLEFHYAGLSADTAEDPAEAFEVNANEEGNVDFTFTAEGEETTIQLGDGDGSSFAFGPEDGDAEIAQYEGQQLTEDDYTVLNANEEAGMYQITNVDDTDLDDAAAGGTPGAADETVSVTLENVVTGETVDVEEEGLDFTDDVAGSGDLNDGSGDKPDGSYTVEAESIEGKDFDVTFYGDGNDEVSFERTSQDTGTQLWPHMYSQTDAAFAVDAPGSINLFDALDLSVSTSDYTTSISDTDLSSNTVKVSPSASNDVDSVNQVTFKFDDQEDVTVTQEEDLGTTTDSEIGVDDSIEGIQSGATVTEVVVDDADIVDDSNDQIDVVIHNSSGNSGGSDSTDVDSFELPTDSAEVTIPSGVASNDATATVTFNGAQPQVSSVSEFVQYGVSTDTDGQLDLAANSGGNSAGVLVAQPEDDNDNEQAYAISGMADDSSSSVSVSYTGGTGTSSSDLRRVDDLDDESVEVGYDFYGAYSSLDTEESDTETFRLHMPESQSTAGMAVTGADGSLSTSSTGGGDETFTSSTPTYEYADGALDTDSSMSDSPDENVVLVGGPAVNTLVADLAEDNQTWTRDEYSEGEGLVQMVPGAFGDNDAVVVAGHSGEDTRAAGEFLADYRDNEADLEGQSQVTVETESGSVVE